jgi:hypothetical protein
LKRDDAKTARLHSSVFASWRLGALLTVAALHGLASATPCAGDGTPERRLELSALGAVALWANTGRDTDPRNGDFSVADEWFALRMLRLDACGLVHLKHGALAYDVNYEPYDVLERARGDAQPWGRFAAAQLSYAPFRWLAVTGGIHKVAFSFGHDKPEWELALPDRALVVRSIAPDRRLGLAASLDLNAVKVEVGGYASARDLSALPETGVLVVARGEVAPFGPVGRAISTVNDAPPWRARPRAALELSALYEWTPEPGATGWAIAGGVPFKWGPVGVVVEYLYDQRTLVESPTRLPAPRVLRQGAWAEVAVAKSPFELVARWDWIDERNLPREAGHALTAGLTLYAFGVFRAQAAYTHRWHPLPVDDHSFVLLLSACAGGAALR